ncbi:MAG: hypothetical protein FWE03_05185 [Firmicutes bacterium]|nr:hypothetical protein [Bacillota bacterium]
MKETQRKILSIFLAVVLTATVMLTALIACTDPVDITDGEKQAQHVTGLINAIAAIFNPNDSGAFNPNDRDAFEQAINIAQTALNDFDSLHPSYRARVANRNILTDAIAKLFELDADAAAQVVEGLVENLYLLMPLDYNEVDDATAARTEFNNRLIMAQAAFDALATFSFRGNDYDIHTRVPNRQILIDAADQLKEFDIQINNAAQVLAVINLINAPVLAAGVNAANRAEFYTALNAALDAYNDLSEALKSRVTNANQLSILEGRLLAHDRQEARNAAINLANSRIDALYALMPLALDSNEAQRNAFAAALGLAESAFDALEEFVFRQETAVNLQSYVDYPNVIDDAKVQYANDHAAIKIVIDNIQYVIDMGAITIANRSDFAAALNLAQNTFDALTTAEKALVTNRGSLDTLAQDLIDFDEEQAEAAAINHAINLINTLYNLMPLAVGGNRTAFVAALTNAQNAYNALEEFVFEDEDPVDLRSYVTNASVIGDAQRQLADFDAISFEDAGLRRFNNTIYWNVYLGAVNYTLTYTYIPYAAEGIYEVELVVSANSFNFANTTHNRGFITNVSVQANLSIDDDNGDYAPAAMPSITLLTELSQTPGHFKNQTFLISSANTTLAKAFSELVEENLYGANHNSIMALLVNNAFDNFDNYSSITVNSSGVARAAGAARINLDQGGTTIVNFDDDGSVLESYKRTFARGNATGGLLFFVQNNIGVPIATRGDRVFFDASANDGDGFVYIQGNNGSDTVSNPNADGQQFVNWDANNARNNTTLEGFMDRHGGISPWGVFGYIVSQDTMTMNQTSGALNFSIAANNGTITTRTFDRAPISFDEDDDTFGFSVVMNNDAGYINRFEIQRAGNIALPTYQHLILEFVVCSITLNMLSVTSSSQYTAVASGITAPTSVFTTQTFEYHNNHQVISWRGWVCRCNEIADTTCIYCLSRYYEQPIINIAAQNNIALTDFGFRAGWEWRAWQYPALTQAAGGPLGRTIASQSIRFGFRTPTGANNVFRTGEGIRLNFTVENDEGNFESRYVESRILAANDNNSDGVRTVLIEIPSAMAVGNIVFTGITLLYLEARIPEISVANPTEANITGFGVNSNNNQNGRSWRLWNYPNNTTNTGGNGIQAGNSPGNIGGHLLGQDIRFAFRTHQSNPFNATDRIGIRVDFRVYDEDGDYVEHYITSTLFATNDARTVLILIPGNLVTGDIVITAMSALAVSAEG